MTIRKPETFWTCLGLFIIGVVIAVNIIRFNFSDFTHLAIFALLTGIGFIVAGYGLWIMKIWGAVLAIILSCLKLIQMLLYTSLDIYTPGGHYNLWWNHSARDTRMAKIKMTFCLKC